MSLLNSIIHLLDGNHQSAPQRQQPTPAHNAQQAQPQSQPDPRMYEDNSFSGNPRNFLTANPRFTFYEDGTFTPPANNRPRLYEDGSGVNLGHIPSSQLNLGVNSHPIQGGFPQLPMRPQILQGGLPNQGPQNLGHMNPQLHDNGYFWNN